MINPFVIARVAKSLRIHPETAHLACLLAVEPMTMGQLMSVTGLSMEQVWARLATLRRKFGGENVLREVSFSVTAAGRSAILDVAHPSPEDPEGE